MGDLLQLKVLWKNKVIEITTKSQDTLEDLKDIIYAMTDIEPHRQNFSNLPSSANVWDDKYTLQDLNLPPDFVLEMTDLLCEPLSSVSEVPSPSFSTVLQPLHAGLRTDLLCESLSSIGLESSTVVSKTVHPPHAGSGDQLVFDKKEFKALTTPRSDKNLLVLDVDQTIYDHSGPSRHFAARPYLHEFLAGVYPDYDIGIWSATDMSILEGKIDTLGVTMNPDYKILFLMDKYAMISVPARGQMIRVKPLDVVWSRYPQFNKTNTVMCDDLQHNFYLNPRNGIVVSPYFYKAHHKDIELLKLTEYLKSIAKCSNLSTIDHSSWNK